jgi:hypothetical protein
MAENQARQRNAESNVLWALVCDVVSLGIQDAPVINERKYSEPQKIQ